MKSYKTDFNQAERWSVQYNFGVYLGWISVATIANTAQVLDFYGWSGWGISGPVWAAVMISIAGVLGILMLWREKDIPYNLVLIWAFIGITSSQSDTSLVVNTAWAVSILLALASLASMFIKPKS